MVEAPKQRRLLSLKLGYRCDQRCVFCGEAERRDRSLPLAALGPLIAALDEAQAAGVRDVTFTGGEPTLHPDLLALLAHARGLGFQTRHIVTNGRTLAAPGRVAALVAAGLTHIDVSVHAPTAALADRLSGVAGGLAAQLAGLAAAVAARGLVVSVNTVILADNQAYLSEIMALVASVGVRHYSVYLCRDGGAVRGMPALLPALAPLREELAALAAAAQTLAVTLQTFGVPLCLLPATGALTALEAHGRYDPVHRYGVAAPPTRPPLVARLREALRDRFGRDPRPLPCRSCGCATLCPIPSVRYLERGGDGWMVPCQSLHH